jgi:hypothetical protein
MSESDYTLSAVLRTVYDDGGVQSLRKDLASIKGETRSLSSSSGIAGGGLGAALSGPGAQDLAKDIGDVRDTLLSAAEAAQAWGNILESTSSRSTKNATKAVHDFFNAASGDFLNLGKLADNLFQSIEQAFFQTLERMAAKAAVYGMLNLFTGGGMGELFGGFGKFLSFDTGGPVPGAAGAPVPAIVHGGEYVLTAAQAAAMGSGEGGAQINLTVNAPVTLNGSGCTAADARTIADAVSDAVRRGASWAVEYAKVNYKVAKSRDSEAAL